MRGFLTERSQFRGGRRRKHRAKRRKVSDFVGLDGLDGTPPAHDLTETNGGSEAQKMNKVSDSVGKCRICSEDLAKRRAWPGWCCQEWRRGTHECVRHDLQRRRTGQFVHFVHGKKRAEPSFGRLLGRQKTRKSVGKCRILSDAGEDLAKRAGVASVAASGCGEGALGNLCTLCIEKNLASDVRRMRRGRPSRVAVELHSGRRQKCRRGGSRGTRADQGVCPTIFAEFQFWSGITKRSQLFMNCL